MAESGENSTLVDCNLLVAKALVRAGIDRMFGVVGIPVTSLANRAVALGIRFIATDFQEPDEIAAVKPFVKFSVKAKKINQIPNSVFNVLDHAGSSRPDGCYLDIPSDVLHQTVTESEANKLLDEAESSRTEDSIRDVPTDEIAKAVSLIRKAERPLIVFGKGAAIARAESELKDR